MEHTTQAPVAPPEPAPERDSFLHNLRQLGRNLHAAVFRTSKPTSDRARTQRVFGNFLYHIHSTRIHLHSLRFLSTLGLGVAAQKASWSHGSR